MTKVAVFATHGLGADCLRMLYETEGIEIPLVASYRSKENTWWDESVYLTAKELGLNVIPTTEQDSVLNHQIDYLLSVYYPNVLEKKLIDHPKKGAINLHQAELPRYRGSNVFAHAIMNAREDGHWRYGTTLHEMVEKVDAGPIIDRAFVDIYKHDTARSLYDRTREASLNLFKEWIPAFCERTVLNNTTPQEASGENEKQYYYPKDSLDNEFEINPSQLAADNINEQLEVYDKIRALEFPPLNPSYITVGGKQINLTMRQNNKD